MTNRYSIVDTSRRHIRYFTDLVAARSYCAQHYYSNYRIWDNQLAVWVT